MPLRNRVTPFGAIIATPARGLLMGNRGILHDGDGRLGRARWKHRTWVCCLTEFRGRRRKLMQAGRYTELFFLDEAVALAAGHRPCFECRRTDAQAFARAWGRSVPDGMPRAGEMDRILHAERIDRTTRRQHRHPGRFGELPDGTFVAVADEPWLVLGDTLRRYAPTGYDRSMPRPCGPAVVVTPRATVAALANGYVPRLHPSARPGGPVT